MEEEKKEVVEETPVEETPAEEATPEEVVEEEVKEVEEKELGAPVARICGCGEQLMIVEGGPLTKCTNCSNMHN